MKGQKFLFILLIFLLAANSNAQTPTITGYARNYTGVLLNENYDYAIIRNTLNLEMEKSKGNVAFKVNPYIYQYPNEDIKLGLRQAYLDIYFDSADIRIGKQQIIWGKADGVFITDVISPKDLSEFLLPDFDEIRMGITAFKGDYYIGDNTFEFVWVPVFTPTKSPEEGSIWSVEPPFPVQPEFDYSQEKVEDKLENSEIFAKYSALTSKIDFEFMAGYMWDDNPTMHAEKLFNPENHSLQGLIITPKHHRLSLAGGSFSTTLGAFVLRGEGAYYSGKYFNSADLALIDGTVEKSYLHYLLGLDYTLWDIHLSGQFIQQAILDYEEGIENDEFENTVTFLANRTFLRETLAIEMFSYFGINNSDALLRPRQNRSRPRRR